MMTSLRGARVSEAASVAASPGGGPPQGSPRLATTSAGAAIRPGSLSDTGSSDRGRAGTAGEHDQNGARVGRAGEQHPLAAIRGQWNIRSYALRRHRLGEPD